MFRMTTVLQQTKDALRKTLKQKLANMTEEQRTLQSQEIARKVLSLPEYAGGRRVCLYLHMKEEVQTVAILRDALATGRECFIPQYIGPKMKMVKLESWEDYQQLPETKWKIKQPADDDIRPDALETGGLDIILVPGLGFSQTGERLGRGKGYYDTYLQSCQLSGSRPYTVGLAYREQVCDDIPTSDHDMKIDIVISPDR
ncbi:5-formyltetrahydrofolate cyclo-ligase-like [Mya arenaria]|uniref:5-formyltetrahydrofolate cyclo-ligase-like n=1 Tax=Mya arenaria TaxID=6604 RepID=UPI0022E25305|nr:5-formyltetrahydrofolate cyclo-ligase-like [Mya arenaria]